ncbi:YhcN/YlaJ family sporulation lipoprotein [Paenibacillus sp. OV219]|uniref:YhcN/YlaJ family sporulation lipoprotein n=1 Tax=Paenibacillus sp. OV219 TaxID=1884377 RepID=UPI0008C1CB22|nr:YhcN/YlaJ family sporulation lipoprotein [Paenibacillus sp. OV219]SEN74430.1 sporulation lipoprotein, YhcN/YlaJ family [Paenibacillus sp. OV219]
MQRKFAMLAAGAMLTTMLTGCMEKQGDLGNRNIRGNSVAYDMNGNRIIHSRFANDQMNEMNRVDGHRLNSNNIVGLHKNYRLEMSDSIAKRLEAMPEVNKAYVMLTDDNAYVAVSFKDHNVSAKGTRAMNYVPTPTPLSRTQQAYQRPYMKIMSSGTSMSMSSKGKTRASSISSPNMTTKNFSMRSVPLSTPTRTMPPTINRPYSSPNSAPLMRSNNNASTVTSDVKDRIASEVRSMAPQIKEVYVSANPDFVDRMTSYMNDVKLGHPIQGFIAEFNAMVDRIFPARK